MISIWPGKPDYNKYWQYADGFKTDEANCALSISFLITDYVWSPIVWTGGVRLKANYIQAGWFALDFDDGKYDLAKTLWKFKDCTHVIGTTKSHRRMRKGVVNDRMRVVCRFSEVITDLALYENTMRTILKSVPADEAPKDGGRCFQPCKEIISIKDDGRLFEPVPVPVYQDVPKRKWLDRGLNRHSTHFMQWGAIDNRNQRAFAFACDAHRHQWSDFDIFHTICGVCDRKDFGDYEVREIIEKARKQVQRDKI